eukprot:TRINITY_DN7212_c0_g1_i6.p1 TRINITY_DN7212_c0_g1~~TRINITY_DN7212_c0_g1_i6.p1  ORF type:complete len:265 (+),score=19.38 TRINITY_DN7212_c0_g1_i6:144-938(+)
MKVLKNAGSIIKHLRAGISKSSMENNYAFYSSVLNGITTGTLCATLDPVFMTVPLDDKIVHRAFGIFETFTISDYLVYNLPKKVESLYKFAEAFHLTPPFDPAHAQAAVIALVRAAKRPACQVTMWMSPGPGDYSLFIKVASKSTLGKIARRRLRTVPQAHRRPPLCCQLPDSEARVLYTRQNHKLPRKLRECVDGEEGRRIFGDNGGQGRQRAGSAAATVGGAGGECGDHTQGRRAADPALRTHGHGNHSAEVARTRQRCPDS